MLLRTCKYGADVPAEQSGNVLDSLNKASGGKAEPLWQDNWDDDDVEDDFTKQLRYVDLCRSPSEA